MKKSLAGIALCALLAGTANAALLSRAGGLAYYDTTSNLTWVADANLAMTMGYDSDGLMTWQDANSFVASLNALNGGQGYLGVNDWRLPTVTDTGTPGCNFAFSGTDCGYNVDLSTGEMAYLYYSTLGNPGYYLPNGNGNPACPGPTCPVNPGPFTIPAGTFWTGTTDATNANQAWYFSFTGGAQGGGHTKAFAGDYAWVMRSGDIPAVPVPGAVWLFGSALAGLGWLKRRQQDRLNQGGFGLTKPSVRTG